MHVVTANKLSVCLYFQGREQSALSATTEQAALIILHLIRMYMSYEEAVLYWLKARPTIIALR